MDNSDFFEFQTFLKIADPPHPHWTKFRHLNLRTFWQANEMAYLHRKRPNFIQKGQIESRLPKTDMKKAYLHQCSARPLILFKTKIKTCLDFNFHSRPIPRQVLKWIFFWDQYQEVSWFLIPVKTNTKTSLDIGNDSRPIPRLVLI